MIKVVYFKSEGPGEKRIVFYSDKTVEEITEIVKQDRANMGDADLYFEDGSKITVKTT